MRGMCRDMSNIWYANLISLKEILDEEGNKTGEYSHVYTLPKPIKASVSVQSGEVTREMFGIDDRYVQTIVMYKPTPDIKEDSIFWIGESPENENSHTHIVRAIRESTNILQIAVVKSSEQQAVYIDGTVGGEQEGGNDDNSCVCGKPEITFTDDGNGNVTMDVIHAEQ